MTLQGSLEHIQLPDVVQLVSTSGKTGCFVIKKKDQEGRIYIKEGQIVHAEVGDLEGESAVYELAIWQEGEFVFQPNVESPKVTVTKSNTNLFMEAARRIDEWKVLSRKIPNIDMIPVMVPVLPQGRSHIQLNTGEWLVIAQINGKRSIREVAKICNLSAFDTAKILYGLITHNLVKLVEPSEVVHHKEEPKEKENEESDQQKSVELEHNSAQEKQASPPQKKQVKQDLKLQHLLTYLDKVKDVSLEVLGQTGKDIIEKQYQDAKKKIEEGKGVEAIQEAVTHIVKAANILKGPSATELLLKQLKSIKMK